MEDVAEKTDAELVLLSLENTVYFASLIARYEAKLGRYIRRITQASREDVEDILQNVFIKAYQNLRSFDPKLSFSSWIYRITHNEVISRFRKAKVRPHGNSYDVPEDVIERLRSDEDVAELFDAKQRDAVLGEALARIPAKYREVLVLRYFEDKSYQEISDIIKKPVGTVGTLLNRAKKQLKEAYHE